MKKYNVYFTSQSFINKIKSIGHLLVTAKDENEAKIKFNKLRKDAQITSIEESKGFYV